MPRSDGLLQKSQWGFSSKLKKPQNYLRCYIPQLLFRILDLIQTNDIHSNIFFPRPSVCTSVPQAFSDRRPLEPTKTTTERQSFNFPTSQKKISQPHQDITNHIAIRWRSGRTSRACSLIIVSVAILMWSLETSVWQRLAPNCRTLVSRTTNRGSFWTWIINTLRGRRRQMDTKRSTLPNA